MLDTLAAAYAAASRFPRAVRTAERAIELALASGHEDLAREIGARLDLYAAGRPYRAEPGVAPFQDDANRIEAVQPSY